MISKNLPVKKLFEILYPFKRIFNPCETLNMERFSFNNFIQNAFVFSFSRFVKSIERKVLAATTLSG